MDTFAPQSRDVSSPSASTAFVSSGHHLDSLELIITPPNPTGSLHLGHALNLTIQDVLARWYRANGADVTWEAAIDHGASSTEIVMHRALLDARKTIEDTDDETKGQQLQQIIANYSAVISEQFQRLGLTADHTRERSLSDADLQNEFERRVCELISQGVAYWDIKIADWCYERGQSIASVDIVETAAVRTLWILRYQSSRGDIILVDHAEPAYLLDEIGLLVPQTGDLACLDGTSAVNPLGVHVPVYCGNVSRPQSLNPSYDNASLVFAKNHQLDFQTSIGPYGRIAPGEFVGGHFVSARAKLIDRLVDRGALQSTREEPCLRRSCRGTGFPISPRATPGLFARVGELVPRAISIVAEGRVTITPTRHRDALLAWMNALVTCGEDQDWRITREHLCGNRVSRKTVEDACPPRFRARYEPTEYRMDLMISCALWAYYANRALKQPPSAPSNAITVIGLDILFYWLVPTLSLGTALGLEPPFGLVIAHPLVMDKEGRKMSKSMGNVIALDDALNEYGAGALRLYLTSCMDGSSDILKVDTAALETLRHAIQRVRYQDSAGACHHDIEALAKEVSRIEGLLNVSKIGSAASALISILPDLCELRNLPEALAARARTLFEVFTAEAVCTECTSHGHAG